MSIIEASPVIARRLHAPELRRESIARDRLVRELEVATLRPLTLVRAPAGYGKTTALAQWLATASVEHAWWSLDVHDNDVERFAAHLLASLRRWSPGRRGAPEPTPSGGPELWEPVVALAAGALVPRDGERLALVLDDYHLISNAACHRIVCALVDAAPPEVGVIVASRTEPPLRLARRRAAGTLSELGREQLRFSVGESERLLNASLALALDRTAVERINARIDGWPAGLALIAAELARLPERTRPLLDVVAASGRSLDAYVVEEVLAPARPELRDFLCRTSILSRLSGPLCAAVLDDARAHELLEEVRRDGLLVTALDPDGTWLRYRELFAATLARELERLEPALVSELHLRACAWFEQAGMPDEAIEHALRAGDGPRAAALLAAHWPTLIAERRHTRVRAVLDRLPDERGEFGPLCEALDVLCMIEEGVDQRVTYQRAEALAARHGDDDPRVRRALERALISPFAGDVGRAVALGREAWERSAEDPDAQLQLAPQLGMALWMAGEYAEVRRLLEPRVQLAQPTSARAWTLAALALAAADEGDAAHAERYAREATAAAQSAGAQTPQPASMHWVLAEALRRGGKLDEARRHLDHALGEEARRPGSVGDAIALVLDSQLALAEHDRRRARESARRARRVIVQHPDVGTLAARLGAVEAVLERRVAVAPLGSQPTEAELCVLALLDGARSLAQIAAELCISRNTVKTHVRRLYRRLGASTREDALAAARERGLLDGGP